MHRVARRVRGPVERFLHLETASGLVLLAMAALALIWANSGAAHSYHDLWHTPIRLAIGSGEGISFTLHFFVNDGLMTIFFLVVGLEIKRELVEGELSDFRRASLPVAAAIGGMVVPALIYLSFNSAGPARDGWGVPMATDIAFAVGILSLLGRRVPSAMRILLLALAIIDDLGAILVIALFYSSGIDAAGLLITGAGGAILLTWRLLGVRPGILYLAPLAVLWAGLLKAGVHPTLAGVIVGLSIPVRPWLSGKQFLRVADDAMREARACAESPAYAHQELTGPVRRLMFAGREALSPVVRGQERLHGWVSFFIMPVFALANAGVNLGGVDFGAPGSSKVMLGIALGLALGKPIGVLLASWITVRLGIATLPRGLGWGGVGIVGLAAGIGFTMAIFIAELAFKGEPMLLGLAKLSILIATAIAAVTGLVVGFLSLRPQTGAIADVSPTEAERSTEL